MSNIIKLTLIFNLVLLFTGCATTEVYRTDNNEPCLVEYDGNKETSKCKSHSIQIHNQNREGRNPFTLGFVEINDQGQFKDGRKQLNALLNAIENTPEDERLIINVFVHGWHHNAKERDPNIESFKDGLNSLIDEYKLMEKIKEERGEKVDKKTKVFGVYVGWRGDSIMLPILKELTFWDRKNTAENVGHVALSELFLRLESIKNNRNYPDKNAAAPGNDRLIIIGHSFGGAAVYQSTAQIMASRFILSDTNDGKSKTIKGLGDLVILINPAFEAIRYAPLFDLAQAKCSYEIEQRPELIVLTSVDDTAVNTLFPIGRFFSTLFESHENVERNDCNLPISYSESSADRTAVGSFEPFLTHELKLTNKRDVRAAYGKIGCNWQSQKNGVAIDFGSTELISLKKTVERNPFLNIKVDPKIIKNHNDIFRGDLLDFLKVATYLSTDPVCKP